MPFLWVASIIFLPCWIFYARRHVFHPSMRSNRFGGQNWTLCFLIGENSRSKSPSLSIGDEGITLFSLNISAIGLKSQKRPPEPNVHLGFSVWYFCFSFLLTILLVWLYLHSNMEVEWLNKTESSCFWVNSISWGVPNKVKITSSNFIPMLKNKLAILRWGQGWGRGVKCPPWLPLYSERF